MSYSNVRRRMIKKFAPFFRKYGRSRKIRKYLRKGYYNNNLSRSVNEFSRFGLSNIPNTVTSRIHSAFTVTFPNVKETTPYGA